MNYDNTNSGVLFKNDRKQKDSHPDYQGQINVNGTDFWLSAWIKASKDGTKRLSLSVKPREAKDDRRPERKAPAPAEFSDDIPF